MGRYRYARLLCNRIPAGRYIGTVTHSKVMKPSVALQAHREEIRRVVEEHHASNARVFGSVARGEDTDESDLDLLIDPSPDTTLFDLGAIRHKLRALLGVPVDVLTSGAIPDRRRDAILGGAVPV